MKKTILSILIISLCSIMITACSQSESGTYSLVESSNDYLINKVSTLRKANLVRVKYENFNGEFYNPLGDESRRFNGIRQFSGYIQVDDDETCTVKFNVVTESGKLGISMEDEYGNILYTKADIPTSNFEFTIDKGGEYFVYFEGEKHKGSAEIVWDYET